MAFLPTDLSSFAWGVLIGGLVAFATGFFQKAGEHTFTFVKNKINLAPPEPEQVDGRFVQNICLPDKCAWVNEARLYEFEQKNYSYYPHPKNNARCYRITSDGHHTIKEYLLVQPGSD
ncbi:MAG: hypothetical protein ACXW11_11490 [Methylotenera sp.]